MDDNSTEEDRVRMKTDYPFFNYYMKANHEKGHRESLNIIWDKLVETKPTYWIHMEDDWVYFKQEKYVSRAISILNKYNRDNIHQVVFNREYGLMMEDMVRVNVRPLEKGVVLHEMKENVVGRNCAYWPHYSLQPSMCRAEKIIELGNYNSPNFFFERDYANKYHHAGYETAFFDDHAASQFGSSLCCRRLDKFFHLLRDDLESMFALKKEIKGTAATLKKEIEGTAATLKSDMAGIIKEVDAKNTGTKEAVAKEIAGFKEAADLKVCFLLGVTHLTLSLTHQPLPLAVQGQVTCSSPSPSSLSPSFSGAALAALVAVQKQR